MGFEFLAIVIFTSTGTIFQNLVFLPWLKLLRKYPGLVLRGSMTPTMPSEAKIPAANFKLSLYNVGQPGEASDTTPAMMCSLKRINSRHFNTITLNSSKRAKLPSPDGHKTPKQHLSRSRHKQVFINFNK